jgi:DNA invertase Pin-like site-specific DNA recombinase
MIFGYARVSTIDQNLDRQPDKLKEYCIDKLFNEKVTGTKKERPELTKMIEQLREGDKVVIESLSRLGRSTKHLIDLMEQFNEMGVHLISLKENIDTTTPTGKLVFNIFASISQFERDLISERTKEGLSSARLRGRNGGRPKKENSSIKKAIKLYNSKEYSIKEITDMTGVSKPTLYRYLKEKVNS